MRSFKLNPLVLAMAVCTLPVGAFAQDASSTGDGTVEEVVVTGSFRDSLANAMNIKKNESGFVDAIVAEDIAEFPDNNLAESLQRIPGVAITRSGGEGRNISVRGLGPNFTRVRINGMESIATTGGTDATGGTNRGRGFDFNTFSSDLFSNITVRKTANAETDEGSLGATVDLKAAQPFDYDGFVLSGSAQAGYNDASDAADPAASFLISNTTDDGRWGGLVSVSYSERTIRDSGTSTVRWSQAANERFKSVNGQTFGALGNNVAGVAPNPNDFDNVMGPCIKAAPTTAVPNPTCTYGSRKFTPRIPRNDVYNHELSRTGASMSLQFKPTDVTEISLDGLWAKHDATREELFMEASLNGTQNASVNITDYEIEGNSLVYAKANGVRLLSENRFDEMSTDFSQGSLSVEHEFTDRLRVDAMVGTSKSDFEVPLQNTIIMQANNQDFSWDYRGGAEDSALVFGAAMNDKTKWVTNSVRQRPQGTVNTYDTAELNFAFDVNDVFTLKAGANYKDFTMETYQYGYTGGEGTSCTLVNGLASAGCGVNVQANADYIKEYKEGIGGTWLVPNRALLMDSYNLFNLPMAITRGSTFDVTEETASVYLQADFKFDIGDMPAGGDIGIRQFETDQSSSAWYKVKENNVDVWSKTYVEHNYDDLLPSLNFFIEPIADVKLRAAYSEGIARAGLGSLAAETNVNVSGGSRSVSSGNPFLAPTKAKSYDLGGEWYFGEGGMLAVSIFKKEIESHVQTIVESQVYTDLGLPVQAVIDACNSGHPDKYSPNCNENLEWPVSSPVNGPGGDLDGYEISYQQPFTFLPGIWSNFGAILSYTSVDSEMDYLNSQGEVINTARLLNLSPSTSNATIYFEDEKFSARVSVANRAEYLTLATADANANYQNGTNETTNVDAVMSYQFTDSIKVSLEALNITNEADFQWVDEADQRLSYYHKTGRQYNLGIHYKY